MIVSQFDPGCHVPDRVGSGRVDLAVHEFLLQGAVEGLGRRVVVADAGPSHRGKDPVVGHDFRVLGRCVLGSSVGMKHCGASDRWADPGCHGQCLVDQSGTHVTGHGVADDFLARCSPVTVARRGEPLAMSECR